MGDQLHNDSASRKVKCVTSFETFINAVDKLIVLSVHARTEMLNQYSVSGHMT
jgi:hypothetical protein